ncbi:hypothetical protein D3C80_702480 [compost metagenome]
MVFGGGEHDLGTQQHPGEQGTEQRDDQTDADQHCAPVTYHVLQHGSHRRVLQFGQFRLSHDAQRQHVDQNQEQQHGDEADDGGLTHVRTLFRPGREDARALDTDEHPDGDQHHVAHLVHHAAQVRVHGAPDVSGKDVQFECEQGDQDEQRQRHDLGHGSDQVDERRFLDPAQDQKVYGPEQHRSADDGGRGIALAKDREEVAQGTEEQDEVADVAQPGTDPVAPGGRKAHVIAESSLGVGIHPTVKIRLAVGQGLEHKGQGQHTDSGDAPADQNSAYISTGSHVLWQRKDPAADHRADYKCNKGTKS